MSANPQVVLDTSMGSITIELFEAEAPLSVKNFLDYVDAGHYDGTVFHRVISNFMIQGGGMTADMSQKPTRPPIKNESTNGLSNTKYTLAMARTSVPDSATSQFFINVVDNHFLDRAKSQDGVGYCVFGKVVSGTDVVDKIKAVATGRKAGHGDVPVEPITIQSAKRSS
jgi:cyclophilin family peptidyl-prolyl cis-trans isomerase